MLQKEDVIYFSRNKKQKKHLKFLSEEIQDSDIFIYLSMESK